MHSWIDEHLAMYVQQKTLPHLLTSETGCHAETVLQVTSNNNSYLFVYGDVFM